MPLDSLNPTQPSSDTDAAASRGRLVLERARAIAPVIAEAAEQIERDARLPDHIVEAMANAGLFRMLVPQAIGGAEADLASFAVTAEVLGAADASAAWCFAQGSASALGLSPRVSPNAARTVFGDDNSVVAAGFPRSPGRADVVPGGYVVSGEWGFASGCLHSTWFDARVRLWRDGTEVISDDGSPVVYSMLVPRAEVEIAEYWPVTGMRGTGSHRYAIRDVFVPEDRSVRWGTGTAWAESDGSDGATFRLPALGTIHIAFASIGLGAATTALKDFTAFAIEKTPGLTRERLGDSASVQGGVGRARALLRAAQAYRDMAVDLVWREAVAGTVSTEARAELRLASIHGIDAAVEVIDSLYRTAGTSPIFEEASLHRRFQDIHVLAQQVVGRRAHYENAGKVLLGLKPDLFLL